MHLLSNLKDSKKATVKQLQSLTGYLNFLNKAIFPGRMFTRRMYSKYTDIKGKDGKPLRDYHHVRLDAEFHKDCGILGKFPE